MTEQQKGLLKTQFHGNWEMTPVPLGFCPTARSTWAHF